MNPFGRLRWFLGRLISPVRTFGPGSTPSAQAEVDTDRAAEGTDPSDDQE
ncbi:MAG TPA: hypothetical protein VN088_20450 [Nocardioides sp.]|nr:hypothetical protein [Nocardioides sp.]